MTSKKKPRARRDYGAGSIYRRASDGRWVGSIEAGWTEGGARRRVTVTAPTEAVVKVRLRKRLTELDEDPGAAAADDKTSVKAWAEQWLTIVERDLRPTTWTTHASSVRRWIVPTIGHRQLAVLTPADVRAVATRQRAAGRTSSTQRRTHSVLTAMLKAAHGEGHRVPVRVLAVKPPSAGVSDRRDLPVALAVGVLGQAALLPHGSRWVAALLQGMRQGEALGLTWDEVDLERGLLRISWQLQPLPYREVRDRSSGFRVPDGYETRQLDGRLHLVRPKTSAGWRTIPLVPWMRTALATWQTAQEAQGGPGKHGLVWTGARGLPIRSRADDAEWYALQASAVDLDPELAAHEHPAGRHYTVHEARHTTATLLLEAGVDPAVITAILGHSSYAVSRGYMHTRTELLASALEQVAERLALEPGGGG